MYEFTINVCAVVSTYNRKHVLRNCLIALLKQTLPLKEIIVVDGPSIDGTDALIRKEFPKITYVRLKNDVGGAGQFFVGLKTAYEKGFDWIWLMDDDVVPDSNALKEMLSFHNRSGGLIFRPRVNARANVFAPLFAGGLFSRHVVTKIGLPLPGFFIYWDDVEYGMRAEKGKIRIYCVNSAEVEHKDWMLRGFVYKKFLFLTLRSPIYPKGRKYYYIWRNRLYVYLRYRLFKKLLFTLIIQLPYNLIASLIMRMNDRALSILKATLDAFFLKSGKSPWVHAKSF
jgi:GT2 family glycosyltransferase